MCINSVIVLGLKWFYENKYNLSLSLTINYAKQLVIIKIFCFKPIFSITFLRFYRITEHSTHINCLFSDEFAGLAKSAGPPNACLAQFEMVSAIIKALPSQLPLFHFGRKVRHSKC